jgi:Holliday junction resolvase RusA-like endonuclease
MHSREASNHESSRGRRSRVTKRRNLPDFRIWVPGRPQSAQKRGSNENYKQRIRDAAAAVVPHPTRSPRLDIEIWFTAASVSRADVDNVIKPVLDALVGIVYEDDRQVRSVRVVAVPTDDAIRMEGVSLQAIRRLGREGFLINVFAGLQLAREGP